MRSEFKEYAHHRFIHFFNWTSDANSTAAAFNLILGIELLLPPLIIEVRNIEGGFHVTVSSFEICENAEDDGCSSPQRNGEVDSLSILDVSLVVSAEEKLLLRKFPPWTEGSFSASCCKVGGRHPAKYGIMRGFWDPVLVRVRVWCDARNEPSWRVPVVGVERDEVGADVGDWLLLIPAVVIPTDVPCSAMEEARHLEKTRHF